MSVHSEKAPIIHCSLLPEELQAGARAMLEAREYAHGGGEAFLALEARKWERPCLRIESAGGRACICYSQKVHFFRGLSLLLQYGMEGDWEREEEAAFASNGCMADCARNGVPRPAMLRAQMDAMAHLGMNRLYLYLEDVLELPGYPYFGYGRGRYTQEEIGDLVEYGQMWGIELVPCIQTLAHLPSLLKQPACASWKDIDDILLVEEEPVRELLRALLLRCKQLFPSGLVHLGMDEAAHLGRGARLDARGYEKGAVIMARHMEWLARECQSLGLEPAIWSDMYLRFAYGVEDYYGIEPGAKPREDLDLPQGLTLCYWDYYHDTPSFYEEYISLHQNITPHLWFAGGAWTWNGISPNLGRALAQSRQALEACKQKSVEHVFCTLWMDNGAETPISCAAPVLALYGEMGFGSPQTRLLEERFAFIYGEEMDVYGQWDFLDNVAGGRQWLEEGLEIGRCAANLRSANPSKVLLYEDVLLGQYSRDLAGYLSGRPGGEEADMEALARAMEELAGYYQRLSGRMTKEGRLASYYKALASLLAAKAPLALDIRLAYGRRQARPEDVEARNALEKALEELERVASLAEKCRRMRQAIWMQEYKAFGYEALDIRWAGVAVRARSAMGRLQAYLSGETDRLEELEEEILPVRRFADVEPQWQWGYYLWERIISRANIEGI